MEQEGTRSEMGKEQEPLKEIIRIIKCTVREENRKKCRRRVEYGRC